MKLPNVLLCIAIGMRISSPTAIASAQVAPSDPNQYMQLAANADSLTATDMKPWHLRAKYQQTDPDGTTKSPGVIEIWWAGPENYKVSYSRKEFTQTEYRVGDKMFLTGEEAWPPVLERNVLGLLVEPLAGIQSPVELSFTEKEISLRGQKLECYTGTSAAEPHKVSTVQAYCFKIPDPTLRLMIDTQGSITSFNKFADLQSHHLATHINKELSKTRAIDVLVEQVDSSLAAEASTLAPPADARLLPAAAPSLGGGWVSPVLPPKVLHHVEPDFHPDSWDHPFDVVVTITLLVNTSGAPADLNAIGGPLELQREALQAVGKYRFKPAMYLGKPIEVEICVDVRF
ncbi:MAG TPA: energy transducer TonB, partial [Acidisarcina sp.]